MGIDGETVPTLQEGQSVAVDLSNGVQINTANVAAPDVPTTNGVVHVIDEVLVNDAIVGALPSQNIVEVASGVEDLSTLVQLLGAYPDLVEVLQSDNMGTGFTVFAPTNAAFEAISDVVGTLTEEEVRDVLLYHVVPAVAYSSSLTDGQEVPTNFGDQTVEVDLSNGVQINGANVGLADVATTNGVVHVIDAVLIPQLVEIPEDGGNDDDDGLSGGEVAGIVIGCLAGVALIAGAVAFSKPKSNDSSVFQKLSA